MNVLKNATWVFLLAGILSSCSNSDTEEKVPPNFVIIMADDLGYGGLASYGDTRLHTPNIDYLAEEGIRFTDFHSNAPVCSPTRAALLEITSKEQEWKELYMCVEKPGW